MQKLAIILFSFVICLFMASQVMAYQPFPDTGQTMCYDADHNEVSCDTFQPGDSYYGQDRHYQPRLPRSYTKLGHGGLELHDSALHVDQGGPWIMTRDNVTGLIWELKRSESQHLQNKDNTFSWYDPGPKKKGGNAGTQNGGNCTGSDCDTYAYIQALNEQQFGGYSDWRIPDVKELSFLVNSDIPWLVPTLDTAWFPNTGSSYYWSSTTYAGNTFFAWRVFFGLGYVGYGNKSNSHYVRAVRSGQ